MSVSSLSLPPHQQLAAARKWPEVGERQPRASDEPWRVAVSGLVGTPRVWTLAELQKLPMVERAIDIHCVTRWSKPGMRFRGVPLAVLLDACRPLSEAAFISFVARSARNHSTSLPLADALQLDVLLALEAEGRPLEASHGGPVRTVTPGRYFYKSLKWLEQIELLAEDRLGFWEATAGYHNIADPWLEQRYMAPNLDRAEVRLLLERRDFSGRDLRSIDARGRDLDGLNARGALLRDAHFESASLCDACFDGANLSNAHLEGADLRRATFRRHAERDADLEGADFRGADLRGADFTGASVFGATFCPERDGEGWEPAVIDASTRIEPEALATLTPVQEAFARNALGLPL